MTNENERKLTRHELFDGLVPHTENHAQMFEGQRSKEIVEYIKKIQRGNLRLNGSNHQDKPDLP